MDELVKKLDAKLTEWKPQTAAELRQRLAEIMDRTDQDGWDVMRALALEQEVLDTLDDPSVR